ncbi:MAG: preprotein translocase subunit SecG [Kiritimatiellia bacterium]
MSVLIVFLTIVEVLCALLLVLLVLLQRSKDEGLGMAFGSSMGESLFGAQAATVLTKATVILAAVFMVNTIMLDRLYSRRAVTSGIRERLSELPATAPDMQVQPTPDMQVQPTPDMQVQPAADESQQAAPVDVALPPANPVAPDSTAVEPPAVPAVAVPQT